MTQITFRKVLCAAARRVSSSTKGAGNLWMVVKSPGQSDWRQLIERRCPHGSTGHKCHARDEKYCFGPRQYPIVTHGAPQSLDYPE
jgi:hypothetical protein